MAVKEVNPLNRRYIELTARFKSSWTFHRFHDGLQKFLGGQEVGAFPFDFQSLYKRLKETSLLINSAQSNSVEPELDAIEKHLDSLLEALDAQDREVRPSRLRLFFQRVKTYDERILIEMVRFYQEAQRGRTWEPDRIDKVDFLVSRLAESVAGPLLEGDRPRLAKILDRLSGNVDLEGIDQAKVGNRIKLIQSVRAEMREVDSFQELTESDLVGHYRGLKHSLGRLFFESSVLPRIVDTNATLSALIRRLSQREEEQIFADYERISELERGGLAGREVLDAVNRLHRQVGGFRKHLKSGNLRIAELAELRDALGEVDEMLVEEAGWVAEVGKGGERDRLDRALDLPALFIPAEARELLTPFLRELVLALAATDSSASPEATVRVSELQAFRLEAREVTAYRRLASRGGCDERLEAFLLTAAALRYRINRKVAEIHGALSASPSGAVPVSEGDQRTLTLADWYLKQFSHFLEGALLGGDSREANQIQSCQVHLMRDYSGMWLETRRLARG